jgi:hypothetical protein
MADVHVHVHVHVRVHVHVHGCTLEFCSRLSAYTLAPEPL